MHCLRSSMRLCAPPRPDRRERQGYRAPMEADHAALALKVIQAELTAARAELAGLKRELLQARQALSDPQTERLKEANGQLVVAALQAQESADSVRGELDALAQTSQRDILTGVPTRAVMLDRLENAIALAQRRGTKLALLFVDVDHFKVINDTLGHAVGDAALQGLAHCLSEVVRHSDTVSRHGGDEFLLLLTEVKAVSDATRVAEKINAELRAPGLYWRTDIRLTVSLGIAFYPDNGINADAMIASADAAMYRAKRDGGNRFQLCVNAGNRDADSATQG
jgi:diguanylate cyclase (GGDEF)-like protein